MMRMRELTAVYVILGRSHVAAEPYDAKAAFVLLNSIADGLGSATPDVIDFVSHTHMVAALGDNEAANCDARQAMADLVEVLERGISSAA